MPEVLLNIPLIGARIVQFASAIVLSGMLLFMLCVAGPALNNGHDGNPPAAIALRNRFIAVAWASFAICAISGAAWALLLAAQISDSSVRQALLDGTVQTLLTRTQFGRDWLLRLTLGGLLASALYRFSRKTRWRTGNGVIATALAGFVLGALAWSGHAGAAPGLRGGVQLIADIAHLLAGGVWLGGLLPLAFLLATAHKAPSPAWTGVAYLATVRFSRVGMAAVGTLIVTGLFNTWVLVGDVPRLIGTEYGQLLLLKVALFLAMLTVAAVNRARLTPRLVDAAELESQDYDRALRQLHRNCLIEAGLGFAVLVIVGALGTISPPAHMSGM